MLEVCVAPASVAYVLKSGATEYQILKRIGSFAQHVSYSSESSLSNEGMSDDVTFDVGVGGSARQAEEVSAEDTPSFESSAAVDVRGVNSRKTNGVLQVESSAC